jgi:hypothetical protein
MNFTRKNDSGALLVPKLSFKGWNEFYDFVKLVESSDKFSETEVLERYSNIDSFEQRWFVYIQTNEVWRLVEPDPPFAGVWEKL